MKINNVKPINFRKTLVAKAFVGETPKVAPVSIYRLDDIRDLEILYRAKNSREWKDSFYLNDLTDNFSSTLRRLEYYVMENEDDKPISFCEIDNSKKKNIYLDYIETAPKYSTNNAKRPLRYIGETMMAFLAKLAKLRDKGIYIPEIAPRNKTLNFYYNTCGFEIARHDCSSAVLKKDRLSRVLASNEAHTEKEIMLEKSVK